MLASFIIRWHTRRINNLLQTIRFLELWHPTVVADSELILVCHDRCGDIESKFLTTKCLNLQIGEMHNAKQTNAGVAVSTAENLVLLDSDRILPAGYFQQVLESLQPRQIVTTKSMRKMATLFSDAQIIKGDYNFWEEVRSETNEPCHRNLFSGHTVLKRTDFDALGGMNEDYIGYGWEDHDLTQKAMQEGYNIQFREETELHLFHEPLTYGKQDQKRLFIQNGTRYCRKWRMKIPPVLQKEIDQMKKRVL